MLLDQEVEVRWKPSWTIPFKGPSALLLPTRPYLLMLLEPSEIVPPAALKKQTNQARGGLQKLNNLDLNR